MTSEARTVEFRILGPLEIRVEGETLALAGGKQRTVLATLLLRAPEAVPIDRLVDEVWGEQPPASAGHTLEVYVSRIRQLLNGHGPSLARRGTGYVLELGNATVDAREFERLVEAASAADSTGEHRTVAGLASTALSMWRGPVLADVAVGPTGRVDADRLEELALRARELWIGAGLALGQHEELVGELQVLVAQNPYRERLVTQLMLALYRSGRHAEALDVYEATRRRLDDDLGLQPSAGLRELSAQVVRQEAGLRAPARVDDVPPLQVAGPARARRLSGLVAAAAAAAAIAALTAAGSARQIEVAADSDVTRVALVLESTGPAARNEDLVNALDDVSARRHLESDVITVAKTRTAGDLERTVRRLVTGRFDLALVAVDDTTARALAPYVPRIPRTRAVFIDASLPELALEGVENADALRYATEDPGLLAGALSGLTPPRSGHTRLPDLVSVVAERPTRATRLAVDAFVRGFRRAVPDGEVRVDYSGEGRDPTACERIANAQIDAGSDVLFVHSRACGRGALAVARSRGVWAISGDGIARPGDEVLASVFKDWDNAVYSVVAAYVDGTLPSGADLVFGLEGYNVGLEMSPRVAPSVQSRVVALCTDIRARAAGATIPTRTGD